LSAFGAANFVSFRKSNCVTVEFTNGSTIVRSFVYSFCFPDDDSDSSSDINANRSAIKTSNSSADEPAKCAAFWKAFGAAECATF